MFWRRKKAAPQGPTPEGEIATARALVERGELDHAASHLAWALRQDPLNHEGRELFRRLITMARDPMALVPFGKDETPDHIAGARAYIHAWRGELDEAVALLVQIYRSVPGLPYVPWLQEWLAPREGGAELEPDVMLQLVLALSEKLEAPEDEAQVEQLLPLLARYRAEHPEAALVGAFSSRLLRELGRLDEALEVARQAYAAGPDLITATMLAGAHRRRGEVAEAVAAFRLALQHAPEERAVLLDIGDMLCESGKLEEGLRAYEEVLAHEPEHPWATPSALYYRSMLEPGGPWQTRLQAYAEAHPDNQRAGDLLDAYLPYVASLPEPAEATVNLLRQLADAPIGDPSSISIGLSSLESPSSRRALDLHMLRRFGRSGAQVSVATIQKPDPRVPRGQVDYLLWRYHGTTPEPAVAPPAPDVAQAMAWLAARPYTLTAWAGHGREVARHLGAARLPDLLGAMVHPPEPPPAYPIWTWLLRVQVAACLTIAYLDGGWQGSLRRRALLSLARGPMDWSVGAALVALGRLATEEPAAVDEVGRLFLELIKAQPTPGGVPYLEPLLSMASRLPSMPIELLQHINELLEE